MSNWEDLEKVNKEMSLFPYTRKNKETGEVTTTMYAPVNERIKAFRKLYPEGAIVTEIVNETDQVITVMAKVYGLAEDPMCDFGREILATGLAKEIKNGSYINKTSYLENCETSAVGRALGFAGFGIDGAVASAEELKAAQAEQQRIKEEEIRSAPIGLDRAITLQELIEAQGYTVSWVLEKSGVESLEDLTEEKHRSWANWLQKHPRGKK